MPKLIHPRRKAASRSRNPRRRAAPKAKRAPGYVMVRGSARNPVQMALYSTKRQVDKAARWQRSHFPHARIRVLRYRGGEKGAGK